MLELFLLISIVAIAYTWYNGVAAKEIATFHAKLLCDSRGFLVLDQTVALKRVRLKRDSRGHVHLKRDYSFEYTDDGDNRLTGAVAVMAGYVIGSRLSKEELVH